VFCSRQWTQISAELAKSSNLQDGEVDLIIRVGLTVVTVLLGTIVADPSKMHLTVIRKAIVFRRVYMHIMPLAVVDECVILLSLPYSRSFSCFRRALPASFCAHLKHGLDWPGRCDVGVFDTIRFVHSAATNIATETIGHRCWIEDQWRTAEQERQAQSF